MTTLIRWNDSAPSKGTGWNLAAGVWLACFLIPVAWLSSVTDSRAAAGVQTETIAFQKGVSPSGDFTGCRDSTLRSLAGESFGRHSLGRARSLNPRWKDVEGAGLLWFDVSSIPVTSQVYRATLKLWFQASEFDAAGAILLHPLHDPDRTGMWVENEGVETPDYGAVETAGCALFKRPGVPWSSKGQGRYHTVISTNEASRYPHPAKVSEWMTFDVTRDVAGFVDDPSQNLGWIFYTEVDDTVFGQLSTSDAPSPPLRPLLEVVFGPSTNRPPRFDPTGDRSCLAGVPLTFSVSARDPDREAIIYSASNLPPGATFSGQTFQWSNPTPATARPPITFYAQDPQQAQATDTIQIIVHPAPVRLVTTNTIDRRIPSLAELLAASEYLRPGDIPEDTFLPPSKFLFVAPDGKDSNAGTIDAPFEHLDRALAIANNDPAVPYTLLLREGVHVFKRVDPEIEIHRSNLYLAGYGNEVAVIRPFYWPNNPSNSWEQRCFVARGAHTNLTFDNLTIEGWQLAFEIGSYPSTPMRQVAIKNIVARSFKPRNNDPNELRIFLGSNLIGLDVYGPGKQIFSDPTVAQFQIENLILSNIEVYDTDLTVNLGDENDANVKGLRISELRLINPPRGPGVNSANDGLAIVNSYKVMIDSCTLRNVNDDGIDTKSFDVAVINTSVEGSGRNAIKFWRNGELINSMVYRCTPIDDGAIVVGKGPCRVIHSSLISKYNGYAWTMGYGADPTDVGSLEIVNSIFVDLDHSIYLVNDLLSSKHSLYFAMRDCLFTGGVGRICDVDELNARFGSFGNISLDPLLIDPAPERYALSSHSPCIDGGTFSGVRLPSFDFFGRSRVGGLAPDIGPVEYQVAPELSALRTGVPGQHLIRWIGVRGSIYDVYSATDVRGPWSPVPAISGRVGVGDSISVTNAIQNDAALFYRVEVR